MGTIGDMQKRLKSLDVNKITQKLKGKEVPVSSSEKIKLLDVTKDNFTFERDITDKEKDHFRDWLKGYVQSEMKKHLKL